MVVNPFHGQIQPEYGDEQADAGQDCPSRETKFSGANGDGEIFIFPVQLTTSRIGNLTRLIYTLGYYMCVTIHGQLYRENSFSPYTRYLAEYSSTGQGCQPCRMPLQSRISPTVTL